MAPKTTKPAKSEPKRKAGRPTRGEAPMGKSLTLRLSDEEHALLERCRERLAAQSKAAGDVRAWSLADVIRRAIHAEYGQA